MHPQPEQESIFRSFCWRRLQKVVNFFGKKVHPRRQNPGYAYEYIGGKKIGCVNVSVTLLQGGRRRAVCTSDTQAGIAEEEGEKHERGGGCEVGETDAARRDRAPAQVQQLLLGLRSRAGLTIVPVVPW